MNRLKHFTMLVFKLLFIVACFALASITTVLQNYSNTLLTAMKDPTGLDGCEIEVFCSSQSGTSLTYQIEDGKIVFDLTQNGAKYDDVAVVITLPAFTYDDSAMREYLTEELGEDAKKEEEYLTAMKNGPWRTTYSYSLTGETAEGANANYTLSDPDDLDHVQAVQTDSEKQSKIEDFFVERGETLSFMITFGAKNTGALPSGRYTFSSVLTMNGLWEENSPHISFGATAKILTKTCAKAIKANGLDIFTIENWLSFYGVMVAFGMFIYLWRDIRCMGKIFCAVMDSGGEMVRVIVTTYVNGVCVDSHTELRGGPSLFLAIAVSILCFVFFTFTIPIRMLIFIIRDIVFLFKEDYDLDAFSYTGNILGSVGVYVLIFGIVGLISNSYLVGGIASVVGLVMCIVASKLCKNKEEYA